MKAPKGILLGAIALAALLAAPALAAAATPEARLAIHSFAAPTSFSAADNAECLADPFFQQRPCDMYKVTVTNVGAKATNGAAIKLTDALPPGLSVVEIHTEQQPPGKLAIDLSANCKVQAGPLVSCNLPVKLAPDESIELINVFTVDGGAISGETQSAKVTGGGSPEAKLEEPDLLDSPPPLGLAVFEPALTGADGLPSAGAGEHPYGYTTRIDLNNVIRRTAADTHEPTSVLDPKDVVIDLPPGLIGAATAAPYCTLIKLASVARCPTGTRVGQIFTEPLSNASINSGLFNIAPEAGVAAEFGFSDSLGNVHLIYASVAPTPAGYVVRATTPDAPQIPLSDIIATFFGDPSERDGGGPGTPMFTNPADCSGQPLLTHIYLDSWQDPGTNNADGSPNFADPAWAQASAEAPAVSGCEALSFDPTISATPETNRADTPTGLDVDFTVPQAEGAETPATPPLKRAVVTLPEGMTVNPSSANGLQGCSLAALGMSASGEPNAAAPQCPDAAKIGAVELETPALPGVLQGQIYVAKQTENPFHSLLALYIVVDDPTTGVVVKIPGEIRANATTGQLETVVDNSPQFPFSALRTHFFGGQRAALRTPSVCGKYTVTSTLTPWSAPESGPPATPSSSFNISQGCASSAATEPNHPGFAAGTLDPLAGAYSPLVLKLTREDGSQELNGLSLTLPEGLIGKLAGIPYCSDATLAAAAATSGAAEQASPSCPPASEVGTVTVGAGAGLEPFYANGRAYLAGPYKGAPLSLAVITPAVAGPFDLGTVVIRNALLVNPETAQITAVSDPIPHILQGIPLDIRSIALKMNRPNFTLNPTNCEKKAISGSLSTIQGQSAPLSNPFQVGGCKSLGFKPKLALSLKGSTKRSGVPALKAVLTYPKGSYANIASVSTVLPRSEFIDNAHIGNVCTRPQFAAQQCPPRSVLGHAVAYSPLLDAPLEGTVYLRSNGGERELPDLVAALHGQIDVNLVGFIDAVKKSKNSEVSRLRTRFINVPDAPVSKFVLQLAGAKHGLLENSANLCQVQNIAQVKMVGQNGKTYDTEPAVANDCAKKGKHGQRGARR